jgi:hypothetical protein
MSRGEVAEHVENDHFVSIAAAAASASKQQRADLQLVG